MDKVCIYGVYGFVGFHFCKRLLEKGFRVEGVYFPTEHDIFLEEKRLEIGRNANFEETVFPDISTPVAEVNIVSLYDYFMSPNKKDKESFSVVYQSLKERGKSLLVFLLPIQLLAEGINLTEIKDLKTFLEQINKLDFDTQYFYLPTIFGPWQPSSFLFQKKLQGNKDETLEIREWPKDAIYVGDILNPMIETVETEKPGSFLLESGIPNSWDLCAKLLKIETRKHDDIKIRWRKDIKKIAVPEITPYQQALMAQKDHLSVINKLNDVDFL